MKLLPAFVHLAHTLALNHSRNLPIAQQLVCNHQLALLKDDHFTLPGVNPHPQRVN